MKNLLEQAVLSLEQKQVREIFTEDEDFYVETCECDSDEFNQMIDQHIQEAGSLIQDKAYVEKDNYIDDNSEIVDFVVEFLVGLGIDADEIDNYVAETLLEDSFLDIEDYDEDNFIISINGMRFVEFYVTYLEV